MSTSEPTTTTETYLLAAGRGDFATVAGLLADDLRATFAGRTLGKAEWLGALERLLPAVERIDVRHLSGDAASACVVYDYVTNTPGGTVTCVELVTVEAGTIRTVELILDRVAFAPVNEALAQRAAV